MIILDITLPGLPDSPNKSRYANRWTVSKNVKRWKREVMLAVEPFKPSSPLTSAALTFIRYSSRRPDYDNRVSSFKALMDGLKLGGIIADDKEEVVGVPRYLWEPARAGEGRVRIIVESIVDSNTLTKEQK